VASVGGDFALTGAEPLPSGPAEDIHGWCLSSVLLFQRRAFVHRDVLGFVAFDLILWISLGRMMRVSFVLNVVFVNPYNSAADMSRL